MYLFDELDGMKIQGIFAADRIKKFFSRFGVEEEDLGEDEEEDQQEDQEQGEDEEEYKMVEAEVDMGIVW